MIQFKYKLLALLRGLGLMQLADKFRYYMLLAVNFTRIKRLEKQYAPFKFPPSYYMFETYHLNYEDYYNDGKQTAKEILDYVKPFLSNTEGARRILDWGCGPARVIRHIPLQDRNYEAYGSDYNQKYVDWCKVNIQQVHFVKNETTPPIPLNENMFDVIYALSIITHLSAPNHHAWMKELFRLLKPGGLLLITSQGDAFVEKLSTEELLKYQQDELVVRSTNDEGNRYYSAFHPKKMMESLFHQFVILDFIKGGSPTSIHGKQDTWLVQKPLMNDYV